MFSLFMFKAKLKNTLFAIAGFTCIGLACLGIVTPILPTTPFLLLALFCFTRSSDRFYNWFISTKLYKKYLRDFVKTRSIKLKTKITILAVVSIMLLTVIILTKLIWLKILLAIVLIAKYYYFCFKLKTAKTETIKEQKEDIVL